MNTISQTKRDYTQEVEQSLLSCLFIRNEVMLEIAGIVSASDFLYPVHADIFRACQERISEGKNASPVTLGSKFENHPDLYDQPDYLGEIAGMLMSATNAVDYAQQVSSYAQKRLILKIMQEAQEQIDLGDLDVKEIRANMIANMEKGVTTQAQVRTKSQVAEDVLNSLTARRDCYSVGIDCLTQVMAGGLYAGYTYGFAGGEKSGKTTLAQTISHNLNQNGTKHAYLAFEMGSQQIEARNMARQIGINSLGFLNADKAKYREQLAKTIAQTPNNTLYLDVQGFTFNQIKSEIQALVVKHKIKGFILDYWQLIGGCPARQSNSDFLFEIVQWIAAFCRKNHIWSIVLSQLNRDGKILGSAGLERACDQLYVIGKAEGDYITDGRYLRMTHSRYTPIASLGSEENPRFIINARSGPYFEEIA